MRADQEEEFRKASEEDYQKQLREQEREEEEAMQAAINMSLEGEEERLKELRLREIEEKRLLLGEEPPSGTEGLIKCRFQMPDGSTQNRCFKNSDAVSRLFDFVVVTLAASIGGDAASREIELKLYPATVLEPEEETSFKSIGMSKNAMVLATYRDQEEEEEEESDEE